MSVIKKFSIRGIEYEIVKYDTVKGSFVGKGMFGWEYENPTDSPFFNCSSRSHGVYIFASYHPQVVAGGFLDLRFVHIEASLGTLDLAAWMIRAVGAGIRVGLGGHLTGTGCMFSELEETATEFLGLLGWGIIGGKLRSVGGLVLVAGGTVVLNGCFFNAFFPYGLPVFNFVTVGAMLLVVAGNAIINGCYFLITELYGVTTGVGAAVSVLGGTLVMTGGAVLITCFLQAVYGAGKLIFVGGGIAIVIGWSKIATIPFYHRAGAAEVFMGGGAFVYVGFNMASDFIAVFLAMAGQMIGNGGGTLDIIGGAVFIAATQFFEAGFGGLFFVGGGEMTIVGLTANIACVCKSAYLYGNIGGIGGGVVNMIRANVRSALVAEIAMGAGTEFYVGDGWINVVQTNVTKYGGWIYNAAEGHLVYVKHGGGAFIKRKFKFVVVKEYETHEYSLYNIDGTKVPIYYALGDQTVKNGQIIPKGSYPFPLYPPCTEGSMLLEDVFPSGATEEAKKAILAAQPPGCLFDFGAGGLLPTGLKCPVGSIPITQIPPGQWLPCFFDDGTNGAFPVPAAEASSRRELLGGRGEPTSGWPSDALTIFSTTPEDGAPLLAVGKAHAMVAPVGLVIMNNEVVRLAGSMEQVLADLKGLPSTRLIPPPQALSSTKDDDLLDNAPVVVNGDSPMPCYICNLTAPLASTGQVVMGNNNGSCLVSEMCDAPSVLQRLTDVQTSTVVPLHNPLVTKAVAASGGDRRRVDETSAGGDDDDDDEDLPDVNLTWHELAVYCDPDISSDCPTAQDLQTALWASLKGQGYQLHVDSPLDPQFQYILEDANSVPSRDPYPPEGFDTCTTQAVFNVYTTTTDATVAQQLQESWDALGNDTSTLLDALASYPSPCTITAQRLTSVTFHPLDRAKGLQPGSFTLGPNIDLVQPDSVDFPQALSLEQSYTIVLSNFPSGVQVAVKINTLKNGRMVDRVIQRLKSNDDVTELEWVVDDPSLIGLRSYLSAYAVVNPITIAQTLPFVVVASSATEGKRRKRRHRRTEGMAGTSVGGFQDAWETSPTLKTVQRILQGDHHGVLSDMMANSQLDAIWSDPKNLRYILDGMPMFKSFRGMEDIAQKQELTPEDGMAALNILRQAVALWMQSKSGGSLLDNGRFAQKLQEYATTEDQGLQELYVALGSGDMAAAKQLQQRIADIELGSLVDLNQFGGNGQEPEQIAQLRELMQNQEPDLYRYMHQGNPNLIKIMNTDTFMEEVRASQ